MSLLSARISFVLTSIMSVVVSKMIRRKGEEDAYRFGLEDPLLEMFPGETFSVPLSSLARMCISVYRS